MAALFVAHLSEMEQLAGDQPAPFVAILGPGGMELVLPRPSTPSSSEGQTEA